MRSAAISLLLALAVLALWNTPFVYPFKIFVVFLHELSHGLAALASGGAIERIELRSDGSGLCVTRGGLRFFVLSAGYLGSLALGALLLVLAARTRLARVLLIGVGLVILLVTLAYVRTTFGFAYGVLAGAALVAAGRRLPESAADLLLKTLGIVSCLYGVWDVVSDVLLRSIPGSDANALGQITGIPGTVWGLVWIVIDAAVLMLALRLAVRDSADA
jgi:hypothetical protein